MSAKLALLAGGRATRLGALTDDTPKSMLDVAGEPFIAHQLRLLATQAITDIVICTGYLSDAIENFVGDGKRFGVNVRYSPDGAVLIGTGGAIQKALPLLTEPFFVMYGDSYLPTDFSAVQRAFKGQGLMTVFHNEGQWDTSNVQFERGELLNYDKKNLTQQMQYIDYGLGVFTKAAFDGFAPGTSFDLAEVFQDLLKKKQLSGYEVKERFYEIGSHQGLAETAALLA